MDIEKPLTLILQALRHSNLHFSAQETPHSLYLSIRKKFLNQHRADSDAPKPSTSSSNPVTNRDLEDKCDKLEKAIKALTSDYDNEISDHEKAVKKRDELARSVLQSQSILENVEVHKKALQAKLNDSEKDLKKAKLDIKEKDKIVHDLKKTNKTLEENLSQVKGDFKELGAKAKKSEKSLQKRLEKDKKDGLNNVKVKINCELCEESFDSYVKMKVHVQLDHLKASYSQTENISKEFMDKNLQVNHSDLENLPENTACFEKYPCFYCGKTILSEDQLQKHMCQSNVLLLKLQKDEPKLNSQDFQPSIPHKTPFFPTSFPPPSKYPNFGLTGLRCEHCGWYVNSEMDLSNHKKICMVIKSKVKRF